MSEVDFLKMHINQQKYQPNPHISQELLKFLDQDLTKTSSTIS